MTSHPAQALTVWPKSGPGEVSAVRTEEDGATVWRSAKTTFGAGQPHEPWPDSPTLTPRELADMLAAELE